MIITIARVYEINLISSNTRLILSDWLMKHVLWNTRGNSPCIWPVYRLTNRKSRYSTGSLIQYWQLHQNWSCTKSVSFLYASSREKVSSHWLHLKLSTSLSWVFICLQREVLCLNFFPQVRHFESLARLFPSEFLVWTISICLSLENFSTNHR